jgi:hypothetical protein
MGGSASITDIGLMLIMNVLLISNFFFVRHLRKIVDKNGVESNNEDGDSRRTLTRLKLMEQSSTSLVKRLQSFYNSSNSDPATSSLVGQSGSREVDDSSRKWTFARIRDTAHVIALGKHRLEPCTERPFTNWEPIPMKMGVMSTALALIVTTLLLSTELYHSHIPDAIRTSDSTAGFCAANATSTKLDDFEKKILKETNYSISNMQWDATNEFRDALLNDTTLYGTEGFECSRPMNDPDTSIPTSKSKYDNTTAKLKYGPYFPGFCPMARKSAIDVAKHPCQTTKEICVNSTESGVQACGIIEVPITCLPHSREDLEDLEDLEGAVSSNYRVEQLKMRDQQDMDSMGESMDTTMEQGREEATEFLRRIFKQISFAGTFYSFYIAIGLFFPTPLRLFRPSFIVQSKRVIFGAHKYTFIATFLIIWWAIQYTRELLESAEVRVYVESIINDPCFLDVEFIKNRTHFVREICTDLIKMGNDWNLTKNQIDPIRKEIDFFSSECDCPFPGRHLINKPSDADMIGFDITELGSQNIWAPKSDFTFLGNDKICRDFMHARGKILESSENDLNFVELWITSGLLATFIVKIAITNFGVALLKLADPFCTCGGKYESPPIRYTDPIEGSVEESAHLIANDRIKENKAASLRALAIRESLIWGFIANASLISLLVAAVQNIVESKVQYTDQDYVIGGILIFITIFMVPLICIILATCMSIVVEVDEADYEENDIEDPKVGKSGNKSNVTQVDSLGFPLKNIRNEEIDSTPSSPESGLTSMSSVLSSGILSVSSNSCQGSPVQRSMQPKTILPSSFNNKSINGKHKTSSNSCQGSPVQRLIQPKTILPSSFNNKSIHGQHESKISDQDVDVDIDSDLSTSTPLLPVDRRNNTMTEFSQIESEDKTSPNDEGSGYINSDHSSTLSDGTEHQNNSTTDYSLDVEPAQKKSLSTCTPQGGSVLVDEKSLSSEETDDRSITDLL